MRKLAYAALPIAVGALLLAGCGNPSTPTSGARPPGQTSAPAGDGAARSSAGAAAEGGPAAQSASDSAAPPVDPRGDVLNPPPAPVLAFDYRFGLALPSDQVRPLMEAHQEACERAGATQCQVVGVNLRDSERGLASGELTLRATPAWMRLFRDRLSGDARDAGGRVLTGDTSGEDVAPQIEAASSAEQQLRAQRAELERQLARADAKTEAGLRQEIAEIDSRIDEVRVQRDAAEGRAAMATMVVDYQASGLVAASGDGAPLAESLRHFWRNTAQVAAVLVDIASLLAPFVIIGAPIWWLVARLRRRSAAPVPPSSGAQQAGS